MSSMDRDPERAAALQAVARALTDDEAAAHPRQRYEAAVTAANAAFRPKWVAAQKLPTLAEQSDAAYAAERERTEAVQAAAREYRTSQGLSWPDLKPLETFTHAAQSECVCTCGYTGLNPAVLRQHLAAPDRDMRDAPA